MSFRYKMKMSGPSIDRWAVPYVTGSRGEVKPLIMVVCFQDRIYICMKLRAVSSKP